MTGAIQRMLVQLRRAAGEPARYDCSDLELLDSFMTRGDQAAFATLVRRHGSMVLGVCRRVTGHEQEAEDAFQAAFCVLLRKARSIRRHEVLASWLYGVAMRTALAARTRRIRHGRREQQVNTMPHRAVNPAEPADWQPLLDAALARLPDKYRTPIVLCDLEGKSRREAARALRLAEGTLSSRLARGRRLLAAKLSEQGVALSGGALATALAEQAARAELSSALIHGVVQTGTQVLAGESLAASVASLVDGVIKAMLLNKLKAATCAALAVVGILLGGAAVSRFNAASAEDGPLATSAWAAEDQAITPAGQRTVFAVAVKPPDLSGAWHGRNWGRVTLRRSGAEFVGTYTDTYGKAPGEIRVAWSPAAQQYEGTWREGSYRFGRIALRLIDSQTIRGAYSADPRSEHLPGVPLLADLTLQRQNAAEAGGWKVDLVDAAKKRESRPAAEPALPDKASNPAEVELRVYEVGSNKASEVITALEDGFRERPRMLFHVVNDRHMIVVAPKTVHKTINQLVERLQGAVPGPTTKTAPAGIQGNNRKNP